MKKMNLALLAMVSTLPSLPNLAHGVELQWRSGENQCFGRWGYQKYDKCTHKKHGVQQYKLARHQDCGVESYKWGQHVDFGVKKYKSGRGEVCGVETYKSGWIANETPCSELRAKIDSVKKSKKSDALVNRTKIFCKALPSGNEILLYAVKSKRLSVEDYTRDLTNKPVRQGPHEAFGVERYRECAHESFGVAEYNSGPQEALGVNEYKECRTQANGVESYVEKRSQHCNMARPTDEVFTISSSEPTLEPLGTLNKDEDSIMEFILEIVTRHQGEPQPGSFYSLLKRLEFPGAAQPKLSRAIDEIVPSSVFCSTGDDLPAETREEVQAKFKFLKSRYLALPSEDPVAEALSGVYLREDGGFNGPITEREHHEVIALLKQLFIQRSNLLDDDQIEFIIGVEADYEGIGFKK
jgi:hypothetical protein